MTKDEQQLLFCFEKFVEYNFARVERLSIFPSTISRQLLEGSQAKALYDAKTAEVERTFCEFARLFNQCVDERVAQMLANDTELAKRMSEAITARLREVVLSEKRPGGSLHG